MPNIKTKEKGRYNFMARIKKNFKRTFIISFLLILILGCAFAAFHLISSKQMKAVYEEELSAANNIITTNTKDVYVATKDIKYGENITAESVTAVSEIVSLDTSMFFTASDIGSIARVDIPSGTVITTNMVEINEYDNTLREVEFDVFVLNSNLTNGDFADVRIRYKNGEDYVVLSKKCVKNLSLRNAICYMDMVEEEMQLISSAIVDASVYDAILYTTTYLDPTTQEASVVTYQPSTDVLRLINNNPNILSIATENLSATAREAMLKRLTEYNYKITGSNGIIFNVTETPEINNAGNMQNDHMGMEQEEDEE